MTIQDALRKGIEILKEASIEAPVVEAGVILCHVLDCDRSYIYTHNDKAIEENKYNIFLEKIIFRAKGLPVQYITGCQEFMSLNFNVTHDTLIPRHDTEVLVETVIKYVSHLSVLSPQPSVPGSQLSAYNVPLPIAHSPLPAPKVRILDIGTGSGCIAISLAYYLDNCHVTAVDISHGALEVARANAIKNGVGSKIRFLEGDILKGLENFKDKEGCVDIIVSNPPYILHSDIEELQIEVKEHEPIAALDGGVDGLDFYREIIRNSHMYLKQGGLLAFEVGYDQAPAVCTFMEKYFFEISTVKDLSGIDRVVLGLLK